jgi:hypothetical protein
MLAGQIHIWSFIHKSLSCNNQKNKTNYMDDFRCFQFWRCGNKFYENNLFTWQECAGDIEKVQELYRSTLVRARLI